MYFIYFPKFLFFNCNSKYLYGYIQYGFLILDLPPPFPQGEWTLAQALGNFAKPKVRREFREWMRQHPVANSWSDATDQVWVIETFFFFH